jgi:hypothetical protein
MRRFCLAAFFRVRLEDLLTPRRGPVILGSLTAAQEADRDSVEVTREALRGFLEEDDPTKGSRKVLSIGRTVADREIRRGAPVTRETREEDREWERLGGDRRQLQQQRNRLWRGEIKRQQYAAWKRHALDDLRRGMHK